MQKEYQSYVATKNSRKVKVDDAKILEAAELGKLELFISQSNIDAQFTKWKNLNTDQIAKFAKYEVEQAKWSDVYISTQDENQQARADAVAKYNRREITWDEYFILINKAYDKMEATRKVQKDILNNAIHSYTEAYDLLAVETDLLNGGHGDPGYIKSYWTSLETMRQAVLSYYEAVSWVRDAEAGYNAILCYKLV